MFVSNQTMLMEMIDTHGIIKDKDIFTFIIKI